MFHAVSLLRTGNVVKSSVCRVPTLAARGLTTLSEEVSSAQVR